jgi:hypothetical protein
MLSRVTIQCLLCIVCDFGGITVKPRILYPPLRLVVLLCTPHPFEKRISHDFVSICYSDEPMQSWSHEAVAQTEGVSAVEVFRVLLEARKEIVVEQVIFERCEGDGRDGRYVAASELPYC